MCLFVAGFAAAACSDSHNSHIGDTETVTVNGHTFTAVKIGSVTLPATVVTGVLTVTVKTTHP
jgi:hypothetical protein